MNWLTKIFGAIFGGDDFNIGTGADADATAVKVNGAIAFKAVSAGGPFGSGYASICYRMTSEQNMDPSLVHRCNSYTWEGSDLTWYGNLTSLGLMIGGRVNDPTVYGFPAYPQARLDVRGHGGENTARFRNMDGSTYVRVERGGSTGDACIIFNDPTGEPLFVIGICPGLFGSTYNNNLTYGKYSAGTGWVYCGTLA